MRWFIGNFPVLALALNRPVVAIAKKLPGKSRLGGTALAYTTLVLLLGCVIWFVIPPIVQQSAKFVESIPSIIDQASSQWRGVNDFIDKNNLRPQVDSMMETSSSNLRLGLRASARIYCPALALWRHS